MKKIFSTLNKERVTSYQPPLLGATLITIFASLAIAETPTPEADTSRAPASTTFAQPQSAKEEEDMELGLFGDWGGARSGLNNWGLNILFRYKGEQVQNFSGGLEKKSTYLVNYDLVTTWNLEKILGIKGLKMVIYGMGDQGGRPSKFVGDSFWTSNIEAPGAYKIFEAYLVQSIDENFSILLGARDLNADYYVTESSLPLINSTFDIGQVLAQTGPNGPSIFPVTALAINFKYESPTHFYFQHGIFNAKAGDPNEPEGTRFATTTDDGYLYIWEAGYSFELNKVKSKYGMGSWSYSKLQSPIDTTNETESVNAGYYVLIDQGLSENTSLFLRYGTASEKVNQFVSNLEIGGLFKGPIPGRPDDSLSLGYAQGKLSKDYILTNDSDSEENVIEAAYRFKVAQGFYLIPDYQIVQNPGANKALEDARVGEVRLEVLF